MLQGKAEGESGHLKIPCGLPVSRISEQMVGLPIAGVTEPLGRLSLGPVLWVPGYGHHPSPSIPWGSRETDLPRSSSPSRLLELMVPAGAATAEPSCRLMLVRCYSREVLQPDAWVPLLQGVPRLEWQQRQRLFLASHPQVSHPLLPACRHLPVACRVRIACSPAAKPLAISSPSSLLPRLGSRGKKRPRVAAGRTQWWW